MERRAAGLIALSCLTGSVLVGCRGGEGTTAESLPETAAPVRTTDAVTTTSLATTDTSTSTTSAPGVDRASGLWEQLGDDAELPTAPPGEVQLDNCRWRSPSLYTLDMTWTATTEPASPIVLPLKLVLFVGDQGTGAVGLTTIQQAGAFTVDIPAWYSTGSEFDGEWFGQRGGPVSTSFTCGVEVGTSGDSLAMAIDPLPPDTEGHDPDSIEGVAAAIPLLDADARLQPLALVYAYPEPPAIDRLFVHPTEIMVSIEIQLDGKCWRVRSLWVEAPGDAEPIELNQRVGCPPLMAGTEEPRFAVEDDMWNVWLRGPADAVETFAGELEVLWSEQVPPFDQATAGFDADEYLDEYMAERGQVELQRFDWNGGRVLAATFDGTPLTMDVAVVTPDGFNGGGGGQQCQAYAVFESIDENGKGLVLVAVTADLSATIDPDGQGPTPPTPLDLVESLLPGIRLGLYTYETPVTTYDSDRVSVTHPDGTKALCEQWGETTVPPTTV